MVVIFFTGGDARDYTSQFFTGGDARDHTTRLIMFQSLMAVGIAGRKGELPAAAPVPVAR